MTDVVTITEAAEHLRVSDHTIERLIAAGKLPAFRVGRQIRIKSADLDLALQPVVPTGTNR